MPDQPLGRNPRFRTLRWTNLWLIPSLCVGLALTVFILGQLADRAHHHGLIVLPDWLDQGGAADLRDLLSATAGAIITTLGLVLSITVLTLSIAATQFGQRMLRRYMRDLGTQLCIGIFAATFVFSLLTLLSVTSEADEAEFVPWLSAWISTLLAVLCIGVLIFFVHHVAQIIQVQHVIAEISADLQRALFSRNQQTTTIEDLQYSPRDSDLHLAAHATGYLRTIDVARLAAAARQSRSIVHFLRRPGEFVMAGSQLAVVTADGQGDDVNRGEALEPVLKRTVDIGPIRSLQQAPERALEQLVEIALRSISPEVNDPYTLIACVDWLGDNLRFVAAVPRPSSVHTDRAGAPRVVIPVATFDHMVRSCFDPLRTAASALPSATIRLLNTIEMLAPHVRDEHTTELHRQADRILDGLSDSICRSDRADIELAYQHAVRALTSSDRLAKVSFRPEHALRVDRKAGPSRI